MAQRETYEAQAHMTDANDHAREHGSSGWAGGTRIVEYLFLLGLALVAILLVGLVSHLLFGSSVSTAL